MNVVEFQAQRYEGLARAYRRLSHRIGEQAIHLHGIAAVRSAYFSAVADLYQARAALAVLDANATSNEQSSPFMAWHRLAVGAMTSLWHELGDLRLPSNTSMPDDADASDLAPLQEFIDGVLFLIDLDAMQSEIARREIKWSAF